MTVKVTGRPELASAKGKKAASPKFLVAGVGKVMVCGVKTTAPTVKVLETVAAGAYVALPAWSASTVQLPRASKLSVLPLTLQTAGVRELKLTARPEVDVAVNVMGGAPSVWVPGDAKVTLCAARDTVNVAATVGAAA